MAEPQPSLRERVLLTLLYPLAALLALMALRHGGSPNFGRDWRYLLGGLAGAATWWLLFHLHPSLLLFFGGYAGGALVCALAVALQGVIVARQRQLWDGDEE